MWAVAVVIAIAICLINKKWRFDPDNGGYTPAIGNRAVYPKFYVHSVSACLATIAMIRAGINPLLALGLIVVFGVMYEFSQGFVNKFDIVADTVGGVIAFLLMKQW